MSVGVRKQRPLRDRSAGIFFPAAPQAWVPHPYSFLGGNMKMIKTMLTATLVAALTGCSYTGAPESSAAGSPVAATSPSAPAPESGQPQVFEGKFVSQAAVTRDCRPDGDSLEGRTGIG